MSSLDDILIESKQEKLTRQIEKVGEKLTGVRREHFIDSRSLCSSCQHAGLTRRAQSNSRIIYCYTFGKYMPEDIVECSSYHSYTDLSLGQMTEIAILIGGAKERKAGFVQGD